MATLVKLDYSGKDINVYAPALGNLPPVYFKLNYDKNNFLFNVSGEDGRKGTITAVQVIRNIENGFYKIITL